MPPFVSTGDDDLIFGASEAGSAFGPVLSVTYNDGVVPEPTTWAFIALCAVLAIPWQGRRRLAQAAP